MDIQKRPEIIRILYTVKVSKFGINAIKIIQFISIWIKTIITELGFNYEFQNLKINVNFYTFYRISF